MFATFAYVIVKKEYFSNSIYHIIMAKGNCTVMYALQLVNKNQVRYMDSLMTALVSFWHEVLMGLATAFYCFVFMWALLGVVPVFALLIWTCFKCLPFCPSLRFQPPPQPHTNLTQLKIRNHEYNHSEHKLVKECSICMGQF